MDDGFKYTREAWAEVGRWIGRTWSLLIAWFMTYAIVFVHIIWPGQEWALYLIVIPIAFHMIAEPVFMRQQEKTFGKPKRRK